MTDVALILSPAFDPLRATNDAPPLGISYLASSLRSHGHRARLLDGNHGEGGTTLSTHAIREWIFSHPVDLVGISTSTRGFRNAVMVARSVKNHSPSCPVVVGGHHVNAMHREVLEACPEIDFVVRGEGEETLVALAEALQHGTGLETLQGITYRSNGHIVSNPDRPPITELDSLPLPARDLVSGDGHYLPFLDPQSGRPLRTATVISSRGCPFSCNFCSIQNFYKHAGKKPWRARSATNVADEVEILYRQHRVDFISFVDDNFYVKPQRTLDIFGELEQRGVRVAFAFATRVDQLLRGRQYLPQLKEYGLRRIELGLEHGSQALLDRFGKQATVAQNREAVRLLHALDIVVKCDWIMFDPDTSPKELEEGYRFIKAEGLEAHFPPLVTSALDLLPGTEALRKMYDAGRCGSPLWQPPTYRFTHPETAQIHKGMADFLVDYQPRLLSLLNRMEELSFKLRNTHIPGKAGTLAELLGLSVGFKRAPYRVFAALLAEADGVQEDGPAPYRRITAGLSESITDAQRLLDRLERELGPAHTLQPEPPPPRQVSGVRHERLV